MAELHTRRIAAEEGGAAASDAASVLRTLHGIYGRGRNWRRFARRFVEEHSGWAAELVDLREHGRSRGFEPPHTVEAAAGDVVALGAAPRILLGHSFGGKIALLALRDAGFRPEQVWVVDASPAARAPSGLPWKMIGFLRAHPGPFEARDEAVRDLETEGVPTPVARWMATNLERDDGRLRWEISADSMESLLRSYFDEDAWDVVESGPAGAAGGESQSGGETAIHFVKASRSDVFGPDDAERIRAAGTGADVHLHEVEGGHWLHTENPEGLLRAMGEWVR